MYLMIGGQVKDEKSQNFDRIFEEFSKAIQDIDTQS